MSYSSQLAAPGSDVVNALLDTLMHDPNVNVRLATVDALRRFADRDGPQADTVRRGTMQALPQQTSPLVQVALIDFAVETGSRESVGALRGLATNTMVDATVRARAERGLQQLGAQL